MGGNREKCGWLTWGRREAWFEEDELVWPMSEEERGIQRWAPCEPVGLAMLMEEEERPLAAL